MKDSSCGRCRSGGARLRLLGAFICIALLLEHSASSLEAATRRWRVGLLGTLWSQPDNWDPRGVPQNGDVLIFDESALMMNDLEGLTLERLEFRSDDPILGDDMTLLGNALTISPSQSGSSAIDNLYGASRTVTITCPL